MRIDPIQNLNIVVYGFDNSGKTTLCNTLADAIQNQLRDVRTHVLHSPGPLPLLDQATWIKNNLIPINPDDAEEGLNTVTIFDRLPIIEEYVYGNVLRNGSNFENFPAFCEDMLDRVFLFIYCRPSTYTILKWGSREQYKGVKENAQSCLWYYDRVKGKYPSTAIKTLAYDFEHDITTIPLVTSLVGAFFQGQDDVEGKMNLI